MENIEVRVTNLELKLKNDDFFDGSMTINNSGNLSEDFMAIIQTLRAAITRLNTDLQAFKDDYNKNKQSVNSALDDLSLNKADREDLEELRASL